MKTALAVSPLILAAIGCAAATPVPLQEADRVQMEVAPPAVLVTTPWKTVRLQELIYKVFWNETRMSSYSVDGIWDPGPELERTLADSLSARLGREAKPLRATLSDGEIGRLAGTREREFKEAVVQRWFESFLHEPAREEFRALREKGVAHLLEIQLVDIAVDRHSWGIYRFQIAVNGRLTRQSDGVVIWLNHGVASVLIEGMNSFADLEKDDLARMKRHFAQAAKALCAPGHPFLEAFSPVR